MGAASRGLEGFIETDRAGPFNKAARARRAEMP
jgi:hypothetical protein